MARRVGAGRWRKRSLLAVMGATSISAANRYLRNWGSTNIERHRLRRGDDLVVEPAISTTKGIDVGAPAEVVWRWLVQIGQDRGGWYSYEWLENLFGLRIHNTDELRAEWQHLAPGDVVRMVPRGWLHLLGDGFGLPVAIVEPPRLLVLREDPADTPWDAVWTFAVEPVDAHRCRLISHSREHRDEGPGPTLARIAGAPFELITHLMTRKMLLTLKDRAERLGTGDLGVAAGMTDYGEGGAQPVEDAAVPDPPTEEEVLEKQEREYPEQAATARHGTPPDPFEPRDPPDEG